MKRILLLGGVTEALAIARTLGPQHFYSLAGVGRVPTDLTCQLKVGGYGGAEGMAQFPKRSAVQPFRFQMVIRKYSYEVYQT